MSMRFDIQADMREAERYVSFLGKGLDKAAARAINKTLTSVRAEGAREVQKKRNLKIGEIKKNIKMDRASARRLTGALVATGRPISIRKFGANQTKQGVTVKVAKQGKRVKLQRHGIKSFRHLGFASGSVFVRTSGRRLPIKKWPPVPGIPTVFVQLQVAAAMRSVANRVWQRRFREEINFEIQKAAARARSGG